MNELSPLLLPNLGAEEGDDWRGVRGLGPARTSALLWALSFSGTTRVRLPGGGLSNKTQKKSDDAAQKISPGFSETTVANIWPEGLGEPPIDPAYSWLTARSDVHAWLNSESIATSSHLEKTQTLFGPTPGVVEKVHDKAFAHRAVLSLDLLPRGLGDAIRVLEPADLLDASRCMALLNETLEAWPIGLADSFTLKPRYGSSGRGRVAGERPLDISKIRAAGSRLAARGGALIEPWLDRTADLSTTILLPARDGGGESTETPTLLGTHEMLATPAGVYRGHCGELDSRGRVFSGHRFDEDLRASSIAVATEAAREGFFGPCGVDALVYREGPNQVERLRPAIEFNARSTMGLVVLGLLRRAFPRVREALGMEPGMRRAFLFAFVQASQVAEARAIADSIDDCLAPIDLTVPAHSRAGSPAIRPLLFFAGDLQSLRTAYRERLDC